jgi:hypothetical protein
MTTPAADLKFEHALKTLEWQIAEATHFWFAAAAMNEVARTNPQTEAAINLTPAFWITARLALEQQAIVTVGKIFGPGEATTKNMSSFIRVLHESRQPVFSKGALAALTRSGTDAPVVFPKKMSDYLCGYPK